MLRRAKHWLEKQKNIAERKPAIRIDACLVEPLAGAGGYRVVIDGLNLHPAISPPRITVGGVDLQSAQFDKDGRKIRGVLKQKPQGSKVEVDFGFAHAQLNVTMKP